MTFPYPLIIEILFTETFLVYEVCIILQIKYCNIALKLFEINVAIIHSVKKKLVSIRIILKLTFCKK